MAKVTAPLFGFSASGKLANSLVYMKWKGINDVRQYVIPANPKTEDQNTQRGYMTSALTAWHAAGFIEADLTAWDRYAGTLSKIMSGFNAFVKKNIEALVASKVFQVLVNADFSSVTTTAGTVVFDIAAEGTTYLHVGTSKTAFPDSYLGVFSTDHVTFTLAGNTASTKYYCYAQNTEGTDIGRTGIYDFITPAA